MATAGLYVDRRQRGGLRSRGDAPVAVILTKIVRFDESYGGDLPPSIAGAALLSTRLVA